jgi:hypothetical protein
MNSPATRVIGLTLIGLVVMTLPIVPISACASTEASDRHEVPAFVLRRTELVPGGANPGFPQPCSRPDGFSTCPSQAFRPPAAAPAGTR